MTYAEALVANKVRSVYMVHFVGPDKRYITQDFAGRTSAATLGLEMSGKFQTQVNIRTAQLKVSAVKFSLVDEGEAVTSWLETNDETLPNSQVDVYFGMIDIAEAEFLKMTYFLTDYRTARSQEGQGDAAAYQFDAADVSSPMDHSLFEAAGFTEGTLHADDSGSSAELLIEENMVGIWPAAGTVLLYDPDSRVNEVVKYTGLTTDLDGFGEDSDDVAGCKLTGLTRRWANNLTHDGTAVQTGRAFFTWVADRVRVTPCKTFTGNPLDIMRNLYLTTAAGGNGAFDLADGNGLGDLIPDAVFDHTDINAKRDEQVTSPFLFVLTTPIQSVKDFVEDELLAAAGFIPTVNANGKLTVVPWLNVETTTTDIAGTFDQSVRTGWRRNWPKRENNVRYDFNWNPGDTQYMSSEAKVEDGSVASFGISKLQGFESRGCHSVLSVPFGMPNLDGDKIAGKVVTYFYLEYGNPPPTFKLQCQWKQKDLVVGTHVTLDHETLRNVGASVRGVTGGEFIVIGKIVQVDKKKGGIVTLTLRQRLVMFKYARVAQDGQADYGAATDAEKLWWYFSDNGADFADGAGPYKFMSGDQ